MIYSGNVLIQVKRDKEANCWPKSKEVAQSRHNVQTANNSLIWNVYKLKKKKFQGHLAQRYRLSTKSNRIWQLPGVQLKKQLFSILVSLKNLIVMPCWQLYDPRYSF